MDEPISLIDLNHLAIFLLSENIFPKHVLEEVYRPESETERKRRLLSEVYGNGPDILESFIEVLELSGHAQAVAAILKRHENPIEVTDARSAGLQQQCYENPTGSTDQLYTLKVRPAEEIKSGEGIYKMNGKFKGLCLIINNVSFINSNDRRLGSDRDAERLNMVFRELGYRVLPERNLEADQMRRTLQEFANRNGHWQYESCVVIILSHGCNNIIYGTDKKPVYMHEVKNYFNNLMCPALRGKPKMFFIQACRGGNYDYGVSLNDDNLKSDATPTETLTDAKMTNIISNERIPICTDMLVSNSTIEGNVAIRHVVLGAWYCQALVLALIEKACDNEVRDILDEVNRRVQRFVTYEGEKQTTSYELIGWTKKLYFNPKIDGRPFLYRLYRSAYRTLWCFPYLLFGIVIGVLLVLLFFLWYIEPFRGMLSLILL